jgi:hypothetical protein
MVWREAPVWRTIYLSPHYTIIAFAKKSSYDGWLDAYEGFQKPESAPKKSKTNSSGSCDDVSKVITEPWKMRRVIATVIHMIATRSRCNQQDILPPPSLNSTKKIRRGSLLVFV